MSKSTQKKIVSLAYENEDVGRIDYFVKQKGEFVSLETILV